jgi:hypothetical protein
MPTTAGRSVSFIIGLVGVSTWISRVFGLMASATFCGSLESTAVKSMPWRRMTLSKKRCVPPYTFSS